MKISVTIFLLASATCFNSIGMSTGALPDTRDFLTNFGKGDKDANNQDEHSPATSAPQDQPLLRDRSRSPPANARCTAPPTTIASSRGYEFQLDRLQIIRLTSFSNPRRILKLRRFTFPLNTPLRLLARNHIYSPMPTQEQIVLSTCNGDIFAILKTSKFLAGIYSYNPGNHSRARAKINMELGMISLLTANEKKEIPVGPRCPILMSFEVERVDSNVTVY